jgi:uncharacterized membrane protein
MAITVGFFIEGIRVVLGMCLLLFIPGYAISLVFYPGAGDIPAIERLILSGIVSIGSSIGVVLLMDFGLGIETTPRNGALSLIAITILALMIWRIELVFARRINKTTPRSVLSTAMNPGLNWPVVSASPTSDPTHPGQIHSMASRWRKKIVSILRLDHTKDNSKRG